MSAGVIAGARTLPLWLMMSNIRPDDDIYASEYITSVTSVRCWFEACFSGLSRPPQGEAGVFIFH